MDTNTVYLTTQAYNNLYSENTKLRLLFERLWDDADTDGDMILFNDGNINVLMKTLFPARYAKEFRALEEKTDCVFCECEEVTENGKGKDS